MTGMEREAEAQGISLCPDASECGEWHPTPGEYYIQERDTRERWVELNEEMCAGSGYRGGIRVSFDEMASDWEWCGGYPRQLQNDGDRVTEESVMLWHPGDCIPMRRRRG